MQIIERLARAMEDRRRQLIGQPLARIWDELAKAAIEEMREPTEEMVVAGCRHENLGDMAGRWAAMIDAALQEGKETGE